ncbi:hypothetical protein LRP49_08460 [Enterovibrio sp. ZSDZ35]|uniref:Uncharacterized protein n=1 Tax=Enterovibrio qingdaonensis TaxID=2899818 RepID=A0ABT5QJR3_9GAMM|nr:hypothetical protein [Enterovibrio sp. ZSDZ35]MDD1781237.1 hypothetical protein [Enterovibrio sp. ZSDZ35]
MSLLTVLTPNWLIQATKGLSSTRQSRQEQYKSQMRSLRTLLWMLHDHNVRYSRCPQSPQATKAREEISAFCEEMQQQCTSAQGPLFRVLGSRMDQALAALPTQSKAAWFAIHHRTSDHLIYIIDEITRSYISETGEDTLYEEYQAFWQTWIDTKEAQLRFEQAVMRLVDGKTAAWQSVKLQSCILQKRMNQLSLICNADVSLAFDRVDHRFDSVIQSVDGDIPPSSLTKISQDLSVILLHLFDGELAVLTTENHTAIIKQPQKVVAIKQP